MEQNKQKEKQSKCDKTKLDWMKEAWRPLLAFTLILILFLYVIVGFFLRILYPELTIPDLPDGVWGLASVFAGAYGLGRSAEAFSYNWQQPSQMYNRNSMDPTEMNDLDELS